MAFQNEAQQEEFLQMIRDGMQRGAAADALGLNRRRVREFITENDDFAEAVLDAEVDATEHVQEALYQAAVSGNVAAARTWLEMKGQGPRPAMGGRSPGAAPPPVSGPHDPFSDLDNVEPIDRRRRRHSE